MFGMAERRLFRVVAVLSAIVLLMILGAVLVWMLAISLAFFYSLIMPLAVAGILALVLFPVVDKLERQPWMNRVTATTMVVLLLIAAFAAFVVFVVPSVLREIVLFAEMVPPMLARWEDFMFTNFPGFSQMVMESAQDGEIKEVMPGLERTGENIRSFAGALVGLSFVPLFLFFALLSGGSLRQRMDETLAVFGAMTRKRVMYFVDVFLRQVTGFFQGQLVIALIMGILFAMGFSIIGLKGGILVGLLLGLLNIVPFLGTLIGLLIVLPLSYMQPSGGFQLLGLSLIVFTVVQLIESWLLTPKIMADRSGLHPALVIIAVLFWGMVFGGITGMILAVPLTAFFIAVWHQVKEGLGRSMSSDLIGGQSESPAGTAPTTSAIKIE